MEIVTAPNGSKITIPDGRIIAYGFSEADLFLIRDALPEIYSELYIPDDVRDILAIECETLIINSEAIAKADRELIIDYYTEIGGSFSETVFWIGYPKPPSHLRIKFRCLQNFGELKYVLSNQLLKAHRRVKKIKPFSKNLADCLLILSLIRAHPGIKTQNLAEKLELPIRTVQRYIATLQATGEWIEYDTKKRGWQLQYGVSILFGDLLENCEDNGGEKNE